MAFPNLQWQPPGILSFPWAEYLTKAGQSSDLTTGHDGVTASLNLIIHFDDLPVAIQQILGFSQLGAEVPITITTPSGAAVATTSHLLHRQLPMRHPRWPQLWCGRISKAQGLQWDGTKEQFKFGPLSRQNFVLLTLLFSRPPYPVIPDRDLPQNEDGTPQEWYRYLDRYWQVNVQLLTRQGMAFRYKEGTNGPFHRLFPGSVAHKLVRLKLKRRWYNLPEAGVYDANGFPSRLCLDPGTGFSPLATVNSVKFLGAPLESLLFEGVEIIPQPLPMPPELMDLVGEEHPLQVDVIFNFEFFSGPRGRNRAPDRTDTGPVDTVGHNCMPWSGDGLFYRVESQTLAAIGGGAPAFQPPFQLFDPTNFFKLL